MAPSLIGYTPRKGYNRARSWGGLILQEEETVDSTFHCIGVKSNKSGLVSRGLEEAKGLLQDRKRSARLFILDVERRG